MLFRLVLSRRITLPVRLAASQTQLYLLILWHCAYDYDDDDYYYYYYCCCCFVVFIGYIRLWIAFACTRIAWESTTYRRPTTACLTVEHGTSLEQSTVVPASSSASQVSWLPVVPPSYHDYRYAHLKRINESRVYFNFQLPSELLIRRKDKFIEKLMASRSLLDYFAFQ